jgi:serine/threonine protein kinase
MTAYASNLVGHTLGRWSVTEKIKKKEDSTGGCFSSGYIVEDASRRRAFLKAINIEYALKCGGMSNGSTMDLLKEITDNFTYERDLLAFCGSNSMDRVVTALDSGEHWPEGSSIPVPYLVFELSEAGDIRRHTNMANPCLSWRFRVFHGVCAGIRQLHSQGVAHQDLKPSNVLLFGKDFSKIADLGRSTTRQPNAKFSAPGHQGQISYAPIELMYSHHVPDWDVRRRGADLYMLGGVFAFLVANVHWNDVLMRHLPAQYSWRTWSGGFPAALPALRHATYQAADTIAENENKQIRERVRSILLWLCEPDPEKRGHPDNANSADRYSLERIISAADHLVLLARVAQK